MGVIVNLPAGNVALYECDFHKKPPLNRISLAVIMVTPRLAKKVRFNYVKRIMTIRTAVIM